MVPVAYGRTAALAGVAQDKGGVDPRLAPAAHEFEASLMQELLKPMERDPLFSGSSGGDGSGLMGGDAGAGSWSSLGEQSLARAISDAGGLGIATKMISEVEVEARADGVKSAGTTTSGTGKTQDVGASAGIVGGSGAGKAGLEGGGAEVRPLGGERDLSSWSTVRRLP
ncbi:MAG: hypothetical protein ACP5M4_09785 [Acidobacteriaceae bacterium]